ncbi:MAG: hypothetical protein ABWY27_10865 [Telluria sp.]
MTARSDGFGMGSTFSVLFSAPEGMLAEPAHPFERRQSGLPA